MVDLTHEEAALRRGSTLIAGLDEVGRGSWAGPVAVGAVVCSDRTPPAGIRDSKRLSPARRNLLVGPIQAWAVAWAVGSSSPEECDRLGMTAALRLAAERALDGLGVQPDHILLDGVHDFLGREEVETIRGGDDRSLTIAAASILAKTARDRIMVELAEHHPAYEFERNKGYPSLSHRAGLQAFGLSTAHRRSWSYVDRLVWSRPDQMRLPV